MGNCVQKPVTWVDDDDDDDDDWEMPAKKSPDHYLQSGKKKKDMSASTTKTASADVDGGSTTTEVKIKVSKKQLEKMLQQAGGGEGKNLKLEQVLMDLVNLGHVVYRAQEREAANRHWRPKLQSIPETAE